MNYGDRILFWIRMTKGVILINNWGLYEVQPKSYKVLNSNPDPFMKTQVEKARGCIELSKRSYPTSCVFRNILDMVVNPPKKSKWEPEELKLVKTCFCQQHRRMCLILDYFLQSDSSTYCTLSVANRNQFILEPT